MNIAGIVILYNPDSSVFDNIKSYIEELDRLYVFDNSESLDKSVTEKIQELPRVQYISFHENKGISFALNTALQLSKAYQFLLTMDQDSKFYPGMMQKYKNIIETKYSNDDTAAMFCVNQDGVEQGKSEVECVDRAITSGSILNVEIANKIGGFDENLFIDEVDNEFCYRAQSYGYKILSFTKIQMIHHLGDPIPCSLFGIRFKALNHNKIRKYYMVRNSVYVMKKYPKASGHCLLELTKIFIKLVFLEPDKINRILFMTRGIKDALTGKMGKIDIV